MYNEDVLKKVIFKSKLFSNNSDVWDIQSSDYSYGEDIMKHIITF